MWQGCIFQIFWASFGPGLFIRKIFWTVVGLGLSFYKLGLDLDRKIWQSAHLCNAIWISKSDPVKFFQNPVQPDPVLKCTIRFDRDPETGSCSTLVLCRDEHGSGLKPNIFRIRTGSDCNFFENWRMKTGSDWKIFCCFIVNILKISKCKTLLGLFFNSNFIHLCSHITLSSILAATWT